MKLLALLLIAVPLGAQQTVVVPDVNVQVEPTPITIENNVEVLTDSVMQLRIAEAIEGIRAELEADECNTCGGASTTNKIAVGVVIPVLIWIALELRGIKNKEDVHEINIPEREKSKKHDDDSSES